MSQSTPNPTLAMRVVFQPHQVAKHIDDPAEVIRLGRQVVFATNVGDALDLALRSLREASGKPGLTLMGTTEVLGEYEIARNPAPMTDKQKAKAAAAKAKRNAGRQDQPQPQRNNKRKGNKGKGRKVESHDETLRRNERAKVTLPPPVGDVAPAA